MTAPALLAISTGSSALSVAVFRNGALAAHHHQLIGRGHAEALIAAIAGVMTAARLDRADVVVVDTGPGSFTGVRIGVAAARALGLAWGAPVTGYEAAGLVAARFFHESPGSDAVTVSIEAGRGQHYRQLRYRDGSGEAITIVSAEGEAGIPNASDVLLMPTAARSLPPVPLYIRPPDAVLPL